MQHPSTGPVRPSRAASRTRRGHALVALTGALLLVMTSVADARSRGSMGSRGSRTNDAPAATQTAPTTAQPMQRTQTTPAQTQARPGTPGAPAVAQPAASRFGGGFFAGLLGAGLLGALFGAGLFGGLGSLSAIFGVLMQALLIGGLIFLAIRFFRRRQQPSLAGAGASSQRSALGGLGAPQGGAPQGGAPMGGLGGGLGAGLGATAPQPQAMAHPRGEEIAIADEDFTTFERLLGEVQTAYGREDVARLWELTTPEMAGYYQEELNENARNGVRGSVSDVKLLQGDLSEAWREGAAEYATVAMRYALTEQVVDRTTGRPVPGAPNGTSEATEVWTFRRDNGGVWKVSAVQQVA
jgi:predicted lipid-binding transport protein (Tim44 family)